MVPSDLGPLFRFRWNQSWDPYCSMLLNRLYRPKPRRWFESSLAHTLEECGVQRSSCKGAGESSRGLGRGPFSYNKEMRKIIQISGSENRIYALCNDHTIWEYNHDGVWTEHPPIPQPVKPIESSVEMPSCGHKECIPE